MKKAKKPQGGAWGTSVRSLALLGTLVAMGLSGLAQGQTREHVEALGVVNGSMTACHSGVEISAFLSGQPVFSATTSAAPLQTLLVEQAQLVSRAGESLLLQQAIVLPAGQQGYWQLPVRVQVNGQGVKVTAEETSFGVKLTLPAAGDTVTVVPTGAAKLFLPAAYRGDIAMTLRITGDVPE
ncbi:DUF5462 family protein [Providencia rettgeri]|uniref:DUF5462 family protein n=1 Tax=Providencia rettgeri TaxID=587 RepID=UPI002361F06D|nr:DUF5462 family protein [Providencia rettgeri]